MEEGVENSFPLQEAAGGQQPEFSVQKFPLKHLRFENGRVDVRNVKPEFLREQQDTPLVMLCGLAMNSSIIENNVQTLAKHGEHVYTIDMIGGGKGVEGGENTSAEINRQAKLLYETLSKIDGKVDLSGISYSALTILALNRFYPEFVKEKVRNVVFIFPMLSGETGLKAIGKKFVTEMFRSKTDESNNDQFAPDEEQRGIDKQVIPMSTKYYTSNISRSIQEIWAIANEHGYDRDLPALFENVGGRIALIQGQADRLVSNAGLWERIGKGSKPPFKEVNQEMYDADPRFAEYGIKIGDNIFDPEVKNPLPPFRVITMREGGHEKSGHSSMAKDILKSIDFLNSHP